MRAPSEAIAPLIADLQTEKLAVEAQLEVSLQRYRDVIAEETTLRRDIAVRQNQIESLTRQALGLENQHRVALEDEREIASYSFTDEGTLTDESLRQAAIRISVRKAASPLGSVPLRGAGGDVGAVLNVLSPFVSVVAADDDTFFAIHRHVKNGGDLYLLQQAAKTLVGNRDGGSITFTLGHNGRPYADGF